MYRFSSKLYYRTLLFKFHLNRWHSFTKEWKEVVSFLIFQVKKDEKMKNFLSCYCSSTRRRVESPSLVNLTFPSHFLHTEIYNETSISLTKVWKRFIRFRGHRGGYMYKGGGNAIRVQATLTWTFFFFFFWNALDTVIEPVYPFLFPPPSFLPFLLRPRFVPFFLQRVSHQRDTRRVLIMPQDRSPLSWPFHETPARAGATYYVPASFRFVPLRPPIVLVLSPYSTLLNVVALKCGGSSSRCQFFPRTNARTRYRFPRHNSGEKFENSLPRFLRYAMAMRIISAKRDLFLPKEKPKNPWLIIFLPF